MATDQIKPALTAEEWAQQRYMTAGYAVEIAADEVHVFGDKDNPADVRYLRARVTGDHRVALAALCNYSLPDDDPRKLVAADIALLDTLISLRDGDYPMLDMYPIAALRAKIA